MNRAPPNTATHYGYDHIGFRRIWATSEQEIIAAARDYLAERPHVKHIKCLRLGRNGHPTLLGSFNVYPEPSV